MSYSQIALWMSDKERYKQICFNGREELRFSNSGMDFGRIVAEALETESKTGDLLTDTAIELLTKYDIRDQEIITVLETKKDIIPLSGRPDTMDSISHNFREYKTGKVPWTQSKAEKHLQLKFYAMLIYLKYGVLLKETYLDWIETGQTSEGIKPTGHIESFKVPLSLTDILETMSLTSRIAKEIELEWALFIPEEAIPY